MCHPAVARPQCCTCARAHACACRRHTLCSAPGERSGGAPSSTATGGENRGQGRRGPRYPQRPDAALAEQEPAGDDQQHRGIRGGAGAAGAEGRGQVLAACRPAARPRLRHLHRRGAGAAEAHRVPAGRLLGGAGGRHDHGGGAAHLYGHAQHPGWRPRRDGRCANPLGQMDTRLDGGGEQARRHHEQVHVSLRQGQHEGN
mmetsp:Transcript_11276/g.33887  ORF Transcript_11276/g.33887 Transcript_11276/m.33887 type:complete len:201 (+) Transcript_11276:231-833(+)